MKNELTLTVNGIEIKVDQKFADWPLVRFLREELRLTGTKQGCDSKGTCGLCKVIINGRARISCIGTLSRLNGAVIETIENLAVKDGVPHPLIQTVIQDGIFQCGYCAPGAIMSAKALLDETLDPTDEQIERAVSGTLCRCAGLNRIDHSIKRAGAIIRGDVESCWTEDDTADEHLTIKKLTGKQIYTDDLSFEGMLYAKAVRANIPHGMVKKIDTSEAQKMPGIVKVLTSQDIPGENIYGLVTLDQNIFCDDVVRYVGDTLALVVGETQEQVEAAVKSVDVEIEPLPVVATIDDAMKADAPVIHERLKQVYPDMPNVLKHFHIRKGDPEKGFEEADYIYEQSYHVPFVEHAYMEPETSIGLLEDDGTVRIYVGSQGPVEDREQVARVLGIDEDMIQITHMYLGGGFGGKEDIAGQIHAALAAVHTGRPVKIHWSREESIYVSYKRHAADLYYKMGMTKDGKLVAADIKVFGDTGAYASAGETVLFRMMAFACGPYEIPNAEVHTYAVHTNNNPSGAFRGYGSPQVAFAAETHIQHMIDVLGLDSIETRLNNALDFGKSTITGDVLTEDVGAGMVQCLTAVKEELAQTILPEVGENEKLGVGIACAYKNVGLGISVPDRSSAEVSLTKNGKFLVRHGGTDMGQGSNQVVATIASRVLGVPLRDIQVHTGDTREDPHGGITTASRATFVTGNAAKKAAEGLRSMLWEAVSTEFGIAEEMLKIQDEVFINSKTGNQIITLQTLASGSQEFKCWADYEAPATQAPSEEIPSFPDVPEAPLHFAYDFGAQAAIVSVNSEMGDVKVHKIIAAHDSGEPIIYKNVIGQIEGAVVQGLGYALSEKFDIEDGIPKSTSLRDLGLLRFRDIPEIVPIPITDPHPKGPFGAKGMGELALSPTAPAVVNAIHDAVGVWVRDLPATPEKILKELNKKGGIEKS